MAELGGLHAGDTSLWRGEMTEHPTPEQAERERRGVLAKPGAVSCRMSVREMPDIICDLEPHDETVQHRDLHGQTWDWEETDVTAPERLLSIDNPRSMPSSDHVTTSVAPTITIFGSDIAPASTVRSRVTMATGVPE